MAKKIVRNADGKLHRSTYSNYLMLIDSAAVSPCHRLCPKPYDSSADELFNNAEKTQSGGVWSFAGAVATWTWEGHSDCDGGSSGFEGHAYANVCIPVGYRLRIQIDGDVRTNGLDEAFRHSLYAPRYDTHAASLVPGFIGSGPPCDLENDSTEASFACSPYEAIGLHILSESGGNTFDAGSVDFTFIAEAIP